MGSLKFLKKIRDKLDEYIENREVRSRQASYAHPRPHSWGPDPLEEERTRRKSYDDQSRRHTDLDLNERSVKMAGNEKRTLRMGDNGLQNRDRVSEGNGTDPRKSRGVVRSPGYAGPKKSSRKSDGELVRRRREQQRVMRVKNRPRASNECLNWHHEDIPLVHPILPQWTAETRKDRPHSPRDKRIAGHQLVFSPRNPHIKADLQTQHDVSGNRAEKQPTVDWDAMIRVKNEQVRLAAKEKSREEEEKKRGAAEQKWKAAERRRRAEEEEAAAGRNPLVNAENKKSEAIRRCEREKAEQGEQEARNSGTEHQCERGKAEKQRKAEEAENKAHAARIQRENEERRLRAFGSPGGSVQPERRPPWPTTPATGRFGPQRQPLEKRETNPARPTAAGSSGQEHRKQQPRLLFRKDSIPTKPQQQIMQNVPPKLAPLTEENLRAKAAIDDDDVDPLGRSLGDNMRTFLQGFALPTIYQSVLTPSTEEEDEASDKNKKSEDKNRDKKKPNK
ncbi:hypothetical protein N431DRAFT_328380 [Stipitochalara longipes BDJ]|nr:hypothetical protein N431DRAFT_328380 [Stipitochalara longipes BDJ]